VKTRSPCAAAPPRRQSAILSVISGLLIAHASSGGPLAEVRGNRRPGEKASSLMGAGKLRVLAGRGIAAAGAAVLASACTSASSPSPPAPGQATGTVTPTVAPSTVPVLGKLS